MISRGVGLVLLTVLLCSVFQLKGQNLPDIDPTTEITIGNIYLLGNNKTRDEIILRELDFEKGDALSVSALSEKLKLDQQKITNTRLFITVEIVPLFLDNNQVEILVRVQERWYIFPIPIFKLADRNFTEWWVNQNRDFSRVNYGAQVNHTNLTGRNDMFRVRAQFGFAKLFSVRYSVPYFNKEQTLGFSFSSGYSTTKTLSYASAAHRQEFLESDDVLRRSFNIGAGLTYRPSFFTRHFFSLGMSRQKVSQEIIDVSDNYFVENRQIQKFLQFNYTFTVDKRDYVAYPLNGSFFQGQLSQIGLGIYNDLSMFTTRLTYSKFNKATERLYLAGRISYYQTFANSIPYSNRTGFGYRPDFVRGYEQFVIESDQLTSFRGSARIKLVEGQKQLNKRSMIDQFRTLPFAFYIKAFADAGYSGTPLLSSSDNFFNNEWIGSLGVGIDIVTYYDFVMRFEYSVNREGNSGFFFNFGSEF